jgi:hypothetical protein
MSDNYELEEGAEKSLNDGESDTNAKDASGKGASFAKPTGSRIPKRLADKNGSDPVYSKRGSVPTSVVPGQEGAQRGMSEELVSMFEGHNLSEAFMEEATTIFEAALNERVSEVEAALEEAYAEQLEEELEASVNGLVEKIDEYLDYAVAHYMEENALAIENGIQVEMAESFMFGLKDLFTEHNFSISEEEIDVVSEIAEENEELRNRLNEAIEEVIELKGSLNEAYAADLFAEAADGLTLTQAEKFSALMEGVGYDDLDTYARKLDIIKENYFGSKKVLSEGFDEEPLDVVDEIYVDPSIAAIAAAISKSVKK